MFAQGEKSTNPSSAMFGDLGSCIALFVYILFISMNDQVVKASACIRCMYVVPQDNSRNFICKIKMSDISALHSQ